MDRLRTLHLTPSVTLKEKRLASLLEGRHALEPRLTEAVENAQIVGSLELAGIPATLEDLQAAREGREAPSPVRGLLHALHVVDSAAPFTVAALRTWNSAVTGGAGALRTSVRRREGGPPPAPCEFVSSRLALLEEWLNVESGQQLRPVQRGALVMTRIAEILPFEDGNGRVARLATSHVMVRGGMRPPVLQGSDAARLEEALKLAFCFETERLCLLLEEASERALDVTIRALEEMA